MKPFLRRKLYFSETMMKILADYHTHTTYSHGKGSVFDNADEAKSKGLKEIAIADHGFRHYAYGIKRRDVESLRRDVLKANGSELRVYLGIEADFCGVDGSIDIESDEIHKFDLLIAGYHKAVRANSFKGKTGFIFRNNLSKIFRPSKALIRLNTKVMIEAMRKYPIDILSHPNLVMRVDMGEIAKVAEETGTYIELNGKRESMSDEDIEAVLKTGAMFIMDSDAHVKEHVGDVRLPIAQAERTGIPVERIVNVDGLPAFKRIKR